MVNSKDTSVDLTNEAARLQETTGNSAPLGAVVGAIETDDGATLRFAKWEAEKRPSKGTVILLHGRSECIEKYFETINDLRKRGFGVLTFDWRGQGGSSRLLRDPRKGHIENFSQYLTDLETILTEIALPDCKPPFYVLAHSTGALVALLAAPALTNRVRRMVLVAPLLSLNGLPFSQPNVHKLAGFLTLVGLGHSYVTPSRGAFNHQPFVSNQLTQDLVRFERNRLILTANEALATGAPTVTWLFAACRAMEQVNAPGFSSAISIPTLMVAPGNDTVVSPAAIELYGSKMRSGAFLTIPGARHELLQEKDEYREQFLAAFDAFVPGSEISDL